MELINLRCFWFCFFPVAYFVAPFRLSGQISVAEHCYHHDDHLRILIAPLKRQAHVALPLVSLGFYFLFLFFSLQKLRDVRLSWTSGSSHSGGFT